MSARVERWIAHGVAAAIPFVVHATFVLDLFYVRGAPYADAGLFAQLLYRNGPMLDSPSAHIGLSYYHTHVAPLLVLVGAPSWVLPFGPVTYFAIVQGAIHAVLACAFTHAAITLGGLSSRRGLALAALIGVGVAVSGIPANAAWLGHYELAIPAALLLFATFAVQGRKTAAWIALGCALALREDAGLHVLVLLGPLLLHEQRHGRLESRKSELAYLRACAIASFAAFLVQSQLFGGHDVLGGAYLGEPPFRHLSAGLVAERAGWLVTHRLYVVLPAALTLVVAAARRDLLLATGWLAQLPWIVLQLCAALPPIAELYAHYPFPLLVAFAWPLVALAVRHPTGAPAPERTRALVLVAGSIALSFVAVSADGRFVLVPAEPDRGSFVPSGDLASTRAATDRFLTTLAAHQGELGRLGAADSVVALADGVFTNDERVRPDTPDHPRADYDSILIFRGGYHEEACEEAARASGLTGRYRVRGAHVVLITRLELDHMPHVARLVESSSGR